MAFCELMWYVFITFLVVQLARFAVAEADLTLLFWEKFGKKQVRRDDYGVFEHKCMHKTLKFCCAYMFCGFMKQDTVNYIVICREYNEVCFACVLTLKGCSV